MQLFQAPAATAKYRRPTPRPPSQRAAPAPHGNTSAALTSANGSLPGSLPGEFAAQGTSLSERRCWRAASSLVRLVICRNARPRGVFVVHGAIAKQGAARDMPTSDVGQASKQARLV